MSLHVAIAGAGVIGLCCARALADRAVRVTVLDDGGGGRDASLAAAGILGAGSEHETDSPLFRLGLDALRSWPGTVEGLGRVSRRPIDASFGGTILLAFDDAERRALAARETAHRAAGLASSLLSPADARRLEPGLTDRLVAALHVPEGRIDTRHLHAALVEACGSAGVRFEAGRPVERLLGTGGRVGGVRAGARDIPADAVVVAAGAWSDALAATTGLTIPARPVKGQLVRIAATSCGPAHVVKRGLAYVVPRTDGLILGTTALDAGFDRSLSDDATASIRAAADALLPGLAAQPVLEVWAGFRPRVAEGLPVRGPVGARPGLHVATGHFRNGILLAALTGELVARAVLGDLDRRLTPFSPDRFAAGTPGRSPSA